MSATDTQPVRAIPGPAGGLGQSSMRPLLDLRHPRPVGCPTCKSGDHQAAVLFDGMLWLDGGRLVRYPTAAERTAHTT